ncbi:hypothetical protein [Emcibacter sp. SYSU 3D8]|uniref:ATP-binding protein n=1 Tax=Emcibacter sp. SYSU 3D8 TaxID=3133969 RepID=UPI0031FF3953
MKVRILRIYHGPSWYSLQSAILWALDGDADEVSAAANAGWPAFDAEFPHATPLRPAANASPTLRVALLIAAWTKELLNSTNGLVEDAGATDRASGQVVGWCGFENERVARQALVIAVSSIAANAGTPVAPETMAREMLHFKAGAASAYLSRSRRVVSMGARSRDIPYARSLFHPGLWHYGWGRAGRHIQETASNGDGLIGMRIARDKRVACQFVRTLGYPAPDHASVASADEAVALAARMGGPVVIKPADGGKGHGVFVNVESEQAIRWAFAGAREWTTEPVLVERFVPGEDYRLLVINGVLVAAALRKTPTVIGDGKRNVRRLIRDLEWTRTANPITAKYLFKVVVDEALLGELRRQGADMDTVPDAGVALKLRGNANVSTGGIPTDVMDIVHPHVRDMAEAIARNVGLHAAGIDYITPDISRSWRDTAGSVIEINEVPGLDLHIASGVSEAEIGAAILGPKVGRIPVAVIIAPLPDQNVLIRLLRATIGQSHAWQFGVLGGGKLTVGDTELTCLSDRPQNQVQQLLQNRQCAAALLCVTPETVAAAGFPVDRCQLTVLGAGLPQSRFLHALAARCSEHVLETEDVTIWPGNEVIAALRSVLQAPIEAANHSVPTKLQVEPQRI